MEELFTAEEVGEQILELAENLHGTQSAAAKAWGVSPQFLNDIIRGRRAPSRRIMYLLGYRKVIRYTKVKPIRGYR